MSLTVNVAFWEDKKVILYMFWLWVYKQKSFCNQYMPILNQNIRLMRRIHCVLEIYRWTSLANLVIHKAPCSVIACFNFAFRAILAFLRCFVFGADVRTDGRTDTMCETNHHLLAGGLVDQFLKSSLAVEPSHHFIILTKIFLDWV